MAKKLRSSFARSILLHAALLIWIALLFYKGNQKDRQIDPITIETITLGDEVKKAIHQVVHSIGLPHEEPEVSEEPQVKPFDEKSTGAEEAPSSDSSGPTSANSSEIQRYLGEIISRINAKKRYPRAAQFNEQEGLVQILLEVSAQGQILRSEVEKACPFPLLNDAALEAVRAIGVLPPLPLEPARKSILLHVPIRFQIER